MNLIYDSGRLPLILRLPACAIAAALVVLALSCLLSIPFTGILPQRNDSIFALILGACFSLLLAICIGSAWRCATRIEQDDHVIQVSRDWLLGTVCNTYEKSHIECFEMRSGGSGVRGTRYCVWLIKKKPERGAYRPFVGWLANLGRRCRVFDLPLSQFESIIELRKEHVAASITHELNRCVD